ncbi:adenylosuccinate synthetase [Anaplasma phagocytophilum]|uniref:adenylosuccinate synthetase n=1 Tax=Anaplasma phagocytophilum TaxID=948 RepID=UPI0006792D25
MDQIIPAYSKKQIARTSRCIPYLGKRRHAGSQRLHDVSAPDFSITFKRLFLQHSQSDSVKQPASHIQSALEPIYEVLPLWPSSTLSAVSKNDLPANALAYVQRIEELVQIHVSLVSTRQRSHSFLGR